MSKQAPPKAKFRRGPVLPGFGLTMGFTVAYLSIIVLLPLAALLYQSTSAGWSEFFKAVSTPRSLASYRITFGASLVAAIIDAVFGFVIAWTLVRYTFPGRTVLNALVDLPFALPTAVSGIALTQIYNENGWLGQWCYAMGIRTAYSGIGICIALTFVGLPFVVRTLQPALEELEKEQEEAAASLGASRWQTLRRVVAPGILPSLLTGFSMAFARCIGEYGSVAFISGNMPMRTEVTSLLIMGKLDQHDTAGAAAIAAVMLMASFVLLLLINLLSRWSGRQAGGA